MKKHLNLGIKFEPMIGGLPCNHAAPPSNPRVALVEANPDRPSERKHLVESAGYWFKAARQHTGAEATMCMENAYNHVENALAAEREKLEHAKAALGWLIASNKTPDEKISAAIDRLAKCGFKWLDLNYPAEEADEAARLEQERDAE